MAVTSTSPGAAAAATSRATSTASPAGRPSPRSTSPVWTPALAAEPVAASRRAMARAARTARAGPSNSDSAAAPGPSAATTVARTRSGTASPGRAAASSATNGSTASRIWSGSIATKWSAPGSSTSRAPGMRPAMYRPSSTRTRPSAARCTTRVGTWIAGSRSRTSMRAFISTSARTAPGVAAARHRSPHQRAIASSAEGHIARMCASKRQSPATISRRRARSSAVGAHG